MHLKSIGLFLCSYSELPVASTCTCIVALGFSISAHDALSHMHPVSDTTTIVCVIYDIKSQDCDSYTKFILQYNAMSNSIIYIHVS